MVEEAEGRAPLEAEGRGRGRGRSFGRGSSNDQKHYKDHIQCHHYKKYGHVKAECWFKEKEANIAETQEEEAGNMFMAHVESIQAQGSIWVVDSGCSNHMTGMKDLFKELDESYKQT